MRNFDLALIDEHENENEERSQTTLSIQENDEQKIS